MIAVFNLWIADANSRNTAIAPIGALGVKLWPQLSNSRSRERRVGLLRDSMGTWLRWEQFRRELTGAPQRHIKVAIHGPKALRKAVAA
ncbi:MAG: hypothetical protein ABIZ64_00075 [Casimicrobium sp.]